MCGLGRLYSKQNVIEQLLDKEKEMPDACKHIKSLKDIKNLVLTPNPAYTDADKTEGLLDVRSAPYICKLIGLEMTGKFRFVALWTCGCVFSERALKEIGSKICSLCQTPFTESDVVILNGNDDEADSMAVKIEARNARRKADKKDKSTKKAATATVTATSTVTSGAVCIKQEQDDDERYSSSAAGASTQPIVSTKIIKTELIKHEKSSSKAASTSTKDLLGKTIKRSAASEALLDPEIKKLKEDSSKDVNKSDVYKSLFTSHKTAQTQDRAHWVTYNPFYN